jgi:hypothetical protein
MEALALVDLGPRLVPIAVRHARLGLSWTVLRVLEDFTTLRASAMDGSATIIDTRDCVPVHAVSSPLRGDGRGGQLRSGLAARWQ